MTPLRTLPRYAWTYVAYWPDLHGPGLGVLKVGRAWSRQRIEMLLASGAHLIANEGNTDETWERNALRFLATRFRPAFEHPSEASGILIRGSGWTECFAVDREDIAIAWDLCLEAFAYGSDYGENPPSAYLAKQRRSPHRTLTHEIENTRDATTQVAVEAGPDRAGSGIPGLPERANGRATDRRGAVAADRRSRPAPARARRAHGGAAFRRLAVDTADVRGGRRPCGPARPHPRGLRLPLDLPRGGRRVAVTAPPSTRARRPVCGRSWASLAVEDARIHGVRFHGFRERERERARARARERARAIESTNAASWAAWQTRASAERTLPEVPLEVLAPPIGCPDHPHGNVTTSCGPCGTAREYRREWFKRQEFEQRLADDEFWRSGEGQGDDEPF